MVEFELNKVNLEHSNNTYLISMNRKTQILISALMLILWFIFLKCSTSRSAVKQRPYKVSKQDDLQTQLYFYRNTDTSAVLYAMFNTTPLLFARLDTGFQFYASVKIKLFYTAISNKHSDSLSKTFFIPKTQENFFTQMQFPAIHDEYNVKIIITDLNKKTQYTYFTELKINNDFTRFNFLITEQDKLLFKPITTEGNTIKIYHRKKNPFLFVDMFRYTHQPAPPPFSNLTPTLNYLPDSSFTIPLTDSQYYLLKMLPDRFYHIRLSQNNIDGLSIFSVDSIFPNLKDAREMLYTSRYIMNKNEFERCNQLNDVSEIKKCIDNFWIQIAGSKERAKEVIKNYYQRVIDANQLFTSCKYGWQTDRGMIYIVFGPPEDIQKSLNNEKWYYSINGQRNALVFNFYKNKSNPFTTSDFILERSDYYKDVWYITVDKIRQGRLSISR